LASGSFGGFSLVNYFPSFYTGLLFDLGAGASFFGTSLANSLTSGFFSSFFGSSFFSSFLGSSFFSSFFFGSSFFGSSLVSSFFSSLGFLPSLISNLSYYSLSN